MSKSVKIWLIAAASLMLVGAMILGGVMMCLKWDFGNLFVGENVMTDFKIEENFSNISVDLTTAHVSILPSEGGAALVKCSDQKYIKYICRVEDGTLYITAEDTRAWYEHITSFHFTKPQTVIYLPTAEYGALRVENTTGDVEISKDLTFKSIDVSLTTGDVKSGASANESIKIKTTTGDITVRGVSAESIALTTGTGDIQVTDVTCKGNVKVDTVTTGKCVLENISCKDLSSVGDTGDVSVKKLTSTGKVSIKRDTGDVNFERWDAKDVNIKTNTGDVRGSFVSDMVIYADSDTGRVSVPRLKTGGQCDVSTDTGDIIIEIR